MAFAKENVTERRRRPVAKATRPERTEIMLNPKNLAPGEEQYEKYRDRVRRRQMVQYDYRAADGKLFSCVRATLEACREARDTWEAAHEN